MGEPWKKWIPGVLSKNQLQELCEDNYFENAQGWDDNDKGPIDYSALDLTLGDKGYRMTEGSLEIDTNLRSVLSILLSDYHRMMTEHTSCRPPTRISSN